MFLGLDVESVLRREKHFMFYVWGLKGHGLVYILILHSYLGDDVSVEELDCPVGIGGVVPGVGHHHYCSAFLMKLR